MDTSLRVLQNPAAVSGVASDEICDAATALALDMSLSADRRGPEFAQPQQQQQQQQHQTTMDHKIPLVKPYFKKKHASSSSRKLDAKCLHRALEDDPILQTLLGAGADALLGAGDGVFVPHSQAGRTAGGMCAAAAKQQTCIGQVCLKDAGAGVGPTVADADAEMADAAAELEETETQQQQQQLRQRQRRRRAERPKLAGLAGLELQRVVAMSDAGDRCFQLKPGLRPRDVSPAAGETATMTPPPAQGVGVGVAASSAAAPLPPPPASSPSPHPPPSRGPEGGLKAGDLFASEGGGPHCLPIKASRGPPPPLAQAAPAQADKGVIFHNKSEEASLDLVFELLTQLQYHTHQSDAVAVCVDFLQGLCVYGSDCAHHHTVLPYHWQIHSSGAWQSIADESQEQLERLYCNPDNEQVRLKFQGRVFSLDFGAMVVCDMEFDRVRRLSTPPSPTNAPPSASPNPVPSCHTVWKYYCRDNFGWREYSEPVVRLIEEASGRGLKEVRFITLQNQYILNIKEGFQQNAVFGFRRQIKKRPMFTSSVMLSPHLQTLGGLSSSPHPSSSSADPLSAPLPLSPTTCNPPTLFPETWLPMATSQDFLQVPVSREDRSYRTVYSLFHKTVSETKFRILKILRVQNPFLWEKYKRKKEYMSRRLSEMDRMLSERHLFHGTSADVVEGICKHNFDPRVCGKHATMFGQGSYFARKAVYSHNFSKRSPKGVHCMFLAKVLTGRFTVGNPSMRRPPPISPRDPSSDLYDSCVDNWVDPQIYVIFNDDQSYPYFIIQYEEVPSTVAV